MNISRHYIVWCDDAKKPNHVLSDKYFTLEEVLSMKTYISIIELLELEYVLILEEFDTDADNAISHKCIFDNRTQT